MLRCFRPANNIEYSETKLGQHQWGEFSIAAVKSDLVVESHSQLESGPMSLHPSGPYGTFVGVYDGHRAPNASEFTKDHLFGIVKRLTSELGEMSGDVLDLSFSSLDEEYLHLVRNGSEAFPNLLYAGSCCLVGVIVGGRVYIANAGDSRAVLARDPGPIQVLRDEWGKLKRRYHACGDEDFQSMMDREVYDTLRGDRRITLSDLVPGQPRPVVQPRPAVRSYLDMLRYDRPIRSRHVLAMPLSTDHTADAFQRELEAQHPHDTSIVTWNRFHGISLVKGILPTTRSIGDAYLKSWEFNTWPGLPSEYRVRREFTKPIISSEPSLIDLELRPEDKFIIFASPMLWKYVPNEEAVDMVTNLPRKGIAKKLLKKALVRRVWYEQQLSYRKLKKLDITERSPMHDDISVVVLFLDHELISGGRCKHLSVISYEDSSSDGDGAGSSRGGGAGSSRGGGVGSSRPGGAGSSRGGGAGSSRAVELAVASPIMKELVGASPGEGSGPVSHKRHET